MTILLLVLFVALVLICLEQPKRRARPHRGSPLHWSPPRAGFDGPGPHGPEAPARGGDSEDVT